MNAQPKQTQDKHYIQDRAGAVYGLCHQNDNKEERRVLTHRGVDFLHKWHLATLLHNEVAHPKTCCFGRLA